MLKKLLVITFFFFNVVTAQAAVIGSFDINESGGAARSFSSMSVMVWMNEGTSGSAPRSVHLVNKAFTEQDRGRTTSLTGPDFVAAAALLTNGTNDGIGWRVAFVGSGNNEAFWFFGDHNGENGIDFSGNTISAIKLKLNSISFDSPGENPNGNGVWTDYSFQATLTVHAVPVPAAAWLFGSALLGLIGFKRK